MELREAMTSAWTNRYYRPDPVPPAVVHRILDAARFAPSGGNRQGWRVVIVRDPEIRRGVCTTCTRSRGDRTGPRLTSATARALRPSCRPTACAAPTTSPITCRDVPVLMIVCVDLSVAGDHRRRP